MSPESNNKQIDFVVGSELRLADILPGADVTPLLKALVAAGTSQAALADEGGRILWVEGENSDINLLPPKVVHCLIRGVHEGHGWRSRPFYHEGEPLGFIYIAIPDSMGAKLPGALIAIASTTLDTVLRNTVKRLLTTQVHTTTVQQSYDELLQINEQLRVSRNKYEELANTLQMRVDERTAELQKAHTRLLQKEKMACIGQLAAGVAHEINTPLNYVSGNIRTLSTYLDDVHSLLEGYRSSVKTISSASQRFGSLAERYRKIDVPYIIKDKDDLVRESLEGTERIGNIVANLKGFSHIDEVGNRVIDINAELEKTVRLLTDAHRNPSTRITESYGQIPGVYGNPALLSQVFLNVLTNALQSRQEGLALTIVTASQGSEIVVSVKDNGPGISDEIQNHIFEPFFTTRDVGQGTGMGLAVAYDIIKSHKGRIAVHSKVGNGAQFDIILPVSTDTAHVSQTVPEKGPIDG